MLYSILVEMLFGESLLYHAYTQQQVSQIGHEMIQVTALKMVIDILMLFGTGAEGGKADDVEGDDDAQGDEHVTADLSFADEAVDKRQEGDEVTHTGQDTSRFLGMVF